MPQQALYSVDNPYGNCGGKPSREKADKADSIAVVQFILIDDGTHSQESH
jgi:hypothetical protein